MIAIQLNRTLSLKIDHLLLIGYSDNTKDQERMRKMKIFEFFNFSKF